MCSLKYIYLSTLKNIIKPIVSNVFCSHSIHFQFISADIARIRSEKIGCYISLTLFALWVIAGMVVIFGVKIVSSFAILLCSWAAGGGGGMQIVQEGWFRVHEVFLKL